MPDPDTLTRDLPGWIRDILPWAVWGIVGGVLALLALDRRPTAGHLASVLLRSCLVGVVAGVILADWDLALGTKVASVTFLAFGSDVVLELAREWLDHVRQHPGAILKWIRRKGGPPPP